MVSSELFWLLSEKKCSRDAIDSLDWISTNCERNFELIRLNVDIYVYVDECCARSLVMRNVTRGKQGWAQNLPGKDLAISLS